MKIILFLSLALLSIHVSAQNTIVITGQVKDNQTKQALEFSTISILNPADSLITGTVTDSKGYFSATINPGPYKIVNSFIGYFSDTSQIKMFAESKFVGVFYLKPNVDMLKEVTVKTNASEIQIDRDVQIVTDKMKEGATSTKDVLEKVNGVSLDRYSNAIKVDNDSKVMILVDGIEKDQEYIKNLAPERLKKIEVIRDPCGKYALEGYSAVINVILKKDYQGTELFVYNRCMLDVDAEKSDYIFVQNSSSGTLNYVYNSFNVYGKYSSDINNFNLLSSRIKDYNNELVIEQISDNGNSNNSHIKQMYNNYTLGADYYINPKNTISLESNFSSQPKSGNITSESYLMQGLVNDSILYSLTTESSNKAKTFNSFYTLFYDGKIDDNNSLNGSFTYSHFFDDYVNKYSESTGSIRNEFGKNKKDATRFYLEYNHTFKNSTKIQLGYGNTWQNSNNTFNDDSTQSSFSYNDFRNKLYAYYSFKFLKKWSMKMGTAAETSNPDANGVKKSYFIMQPYADLQFKLNKSVNFKAKYRTSSTYPDASQTNPFTYVIDQTSIKTGNPNLKPELTHRFSLQTNIMEGFITIEPYYHYSSNMITEIGNLRNDGIFEYNVDNIGVYKNMGVEARLAFPLGKSIYLENSVDLFDNSITYQGKENRFKDWTMSSQLVYFKEKSGLVAGFQYQNNLRKYISAQGYGKGDNDFWIVFVQKPFLKKRLSVMLLYFTPITWGVDFNQGGFIKTETYSETKNYDISLLKNMVMLEVHYRFNKGKSVTKIDKKANEDGGRKPKSLF